MKKDCLSAFLFIVSQSEWTIVEQNPAIREEKFSTQERAKSETDVHAANVSSWVREILMIKP